VHLLDTNSRALTPSTATQNALPIAAGVVVATVASALLNRWLAQRAERRNPPIGRFITVFASTTSNGGQEPLWSCSTATGV
jgi:hypothetical protein